MNTPNANRAITTLKKLSLQLGPELLAYLVAPNIILTLSGARAYCDGVLWDDQHEDNQLLDTWQNESRAVLQALADIEPPVYFSSTISKNPSGEAFADYEYVTRSGLAYMQSTTNLLRKNPRINTKSKNEVEIIGSIVENLAPDNSFITNNPKYHNDIAFGLLLGYPDEAIISFLKSYDSADDPFYEADTMADIQGADYYSCPQPRYHYPRGLLDDPAAFEIIRGHERQWSTILKDYYTSDFHKQLEKNADFIKKITELSLQRDS